MTVQLFVGKAFELEFGLTWFYLRVGEKDYLFPKSKR